VDLYLIDFLGEIVGLLHETYAYPTPAGIEDFARRGIGTLVDGIPDRVRQRIVGLGIAAPYEMWTWPAEIGAPAGDIEAWRSVDIRARLETLCPWPVYVSNDITAACAAELMFGQGA